MNNCEHYWSQNPGEQECLFCRATRQTPAEAPAPSQTEPRQGININSHPLIRQSYEVSLAIEECAASEQQTAASIKSSALTTAISNLLSDDNYVAFLRWAGDTQHRHLVLCNSDDERAFKVYRWPRVPQAAQTVASPTAEEVARQYCVDQDYLDSFVAAIRDYAATLTHAPETVASPTLVEQARTYFQREYDRDPKQSIFVGMANFASIHAATIAAERDRQYEYNLDQLVKITQLEDRIAELLEQNSPPKHTEGHVDCPACERARWDEVRKGNDAATTTD